MWWNTSLCSLGEIKPSQLTEKKPRNNPTICSPLRPETFLNSPNHTAQPVDTSFLAALITQRSVVQIHPPQPTNLLNHHAFAPSEGFLLCQPGHIWTQHLTQLFGDQPVIFLNGVSVDAKREARSRSVSESLLAYLHGCIEPIHQASVRVSECMKSAAPNPEGFQQRVEFPFDN